MTLPPSPPTAATETTTSTPAVEAPSASPAAQPGPKTNLRYFTQPDILLKIGCRRLALLLERFSQELMPLNLPTPPDADEDTIYSHLPTRTDLQSHKLEPALTANLR